MTTPTPADRAAEKLKEAFSIGTFSRFCDEPADFDSAETEAIAQIITASYAPMVEALEAVTNALVKTVNRAYPGYPEDQMMVAKELSVADVRRIIEQNQLLEMSTEKHTPEEDVHGHVAAIKHRMVLMTPEERESLMNELAETYCRYCWIMTNGETCHCTNDE